MSQFSCHYGGSLDARFSRDVGFRVITREALTAFWGNSTLANERGVYVFAIKRRGPGAAIPFYVGKAARTTFVTETFNDRNRAAYTAALFDSEGTPEIHLVKLERQRGPINYTAIDNLETLLIWIARHRNPALLNRRKIDSRPAHLMELFSANRVIGVLNTGSGRISDTAQNFRRVMGL